MLPVARRLTAAFLRLLCLSVLCLSAPAGAAERILNFASDITVNADASLQVRESITVVAEGRSIRRGIYRDFPTRYEDRYGNTVNVDFSVVDVQRDGVAENYRLEKLSNGVRIRIGRADYILQPGEHTYVIRYRTTRQLGYFRDFDELYWNVTGNAWAFPIEAASARVTLPPGARVVRKAAYTGRQGETGQDYRPLDQSSGTGWVTTRTLRPGEGFTVAVAWPKGFVAEPDNATRARWFMRDNAATAVALAGSLLLLAFYLLTWRRYGKDPLGGAIIPRFEPPAGLSPAACRFIRLMSFDKKAYSAALVNMAVKGFLTIAEAGRKKFRLTRVPGAKLEPLAGGERRIAKHLLLSRDSILLDNKNHQVLHESVGKLRLSLETEYELAAFKRNTWLFVIGMLISIGTLIATVAVGAQFVSIGAGILVSLFTAALTYLVLHFWGGDTDPTFKAMPFRKLPTSGIATFLLQVVIMFFIAGINSLQALWLQITSAPVLTFCYALLGGLNIVFFFLLKQPTLAGRKLMDEIEGFRMYLGTAEENRLKFLHPPDKTPELFEKYLPYAMALDVENEWNDKFAAVLAAASTDPDSAGGGYRPRWYRGTRWQAGRAGSLAASMGSAVASSVRAPGSSSGSGGGGFSGGGGGGGGGGGW